METAIVLTGGLLHTSDAKTAHGLIRESNRFTIVGIVDALNSGKDAGVVLDGKHRNLPVFENITESFILKPAYCIIGVATQGGVFPESMLAEVMSAVQHGISIINGLHDYLSERPEMVELAKQHDVQLIDIRKPKSRNQLHFWTGKIRELKTPVIAILGTDCALGKRTTTRLLLHELSRNSIPAQMIYTGQTGWLQGGKYGFIFDSTLNDFVGGELENAVLTCANETNPEVILIEGQAALRNPSGPCGSEMLISGQARHVVLVHAPKRKYFDHDPHLGEIHDLESELKLIELYGSTVIAIALNTENCNIEEAKKIKQEYSGKFKLPVILPLEEGCAELVPVIKKLMS